MNDSMEKLIHMMAPDNEDEQRRLRFRLSEVLMEVRIYYNRHPDSTLGYLQVYRKVKRQVAWRIVKAYLLRPSRRLDTAVRTLFLAKN